MPELGYVLYLFGLAYAFGQLWSAVIDHRHDHWMRIASFPFLGIVAGEALFPMGPQFFGVHVLVAFIATLVAVLVDKLVHMVRPEPETAMHPAHA
jgi:predicted MFS family arabinose efflux permease